MPADASAKDHIISEIARLVTDVIGDEYLLATDISASTAFVADLELESIDFVSLGARLQDLYREVDFVSFVAELEIDDLADLTVGEFADYISRCLFEGGRA
jgi:acyl carrier protein